MRMYCAYIGEVYILHKIDKHVFICYNILDEYIAIFFKFYNCNMGIFKGWYSI